MRKYILVVAVFALLWWLGDHRGEVSLGAGVKAPQEPYQLNLEDASTFDHQGYQVTPLADFRITAKVLGARSYWMGQEAALSPLDLALGWGPMSDEAILSAFEISQSNRWFYWRAQDLPISRREAAVHSANMHLIPSSAGVEAALDELRVGDIIELQGWLVEVAGDDGWRWRSSLSREDTGNHACELVWVDQLVNLTATIDR